MIAVGSLLVCVFAGIVRGQDAFAGFGHPAVITVAAVLVLSRGLLVTGAVDALVQRLLPAASGPTLTVAALTGLGAMLSAFMNNVGALALLMPAAIQIAAKQKLPPGKVLMPLSFGTILGGMTTLIGTPPNLIVSAFRSEATGSSFTMFDFTPVGLAVAVVGVMFVAILGWRIVPRREPADVASFVTGTYITEVRVTEGAKVADKTISDVESILQDADAQVVGMVRNEVRVVAPNPHRVLRPGDILIIEAEPESLASVLSSLGLKLEEAAPRSKKGQEDAEAKAGKPENKPDEGKLDDRKRIESEETALQELVVMPNSDLLGRSVSGIQVRDRYGLNLLALSRQGRRSVKRLRSTLIQAGDVLLMQGSPESLSAFAAEFGCVPLAKRAIRIPNKRQAIIATVVMVTAIGGATFGLLPAAVFFAAGILVLMLLRVIQWRAVYEAIDWPVVVLLGALIPVAGAMASTGAADVLARLLLKAIAHGHPAVAIGVILVVTMTLSDFMNNAATAAVMCQIAVSTAAQMGVDADPFLMAVAIGSSCAFLTPIGHQNNTLILGPGGFRFGDYWRMGLPLEVIVAAVSLPILLLVWPL